MLKIIVPKHVSVGNCKSGGVGIHSFFLRKRVYMQTGLIHNQIKWSLEEAENEDYVYESYATICIHVSRFPQLQILLYFNDVSNQQDATTFSFINPFSSALHVSGDKFAHPQEHFFTVYTAFGTMHCNDKL